MEILANLAQIFRDNLLPIFLLAWLGYVLERRLGLEMRTLSRLNIWIFVPAFALDRLSRAELEGEHLLLVVVFTLALQAVLWGLSAGWARLRGYSSSLGAAFACSLIFYNSGNYGLPLMELLYGAGSVVVGLQTIVLAVQNATCFSFGIMLIRGQQIGAGRALLDYFKLPFPYCIGLGILVQQTALELPPVVAEPTRLAADGLVPIALLTLGAQLARVQWHASARPAFASSFFRLLVGPLVALGLIELLGLSGLLAQWLLIASAVPTAVNTTILAIEYDNEPDFASQAVLVSTLASGVTVAAVIYLARVLYPV